MAGVGGLKGALLTSPQMSPSLLIPPIFSEWRSLVRSSIDGGIVLRARRSLSDSNGDSEERENLQTTSS